MSNGSNLGELIKMNKERYYFLDILRVFSTFAVIFLHVVSKEFWHVSADSVEWNIINLACGSVRWCVPVFVMISGALWLNPQKDVPTQTIVKGIARIISAFVFWSVVYALINGNGYKDIVYQIFNGHYHMWFLFMIVGLYLIIPFLRQITSDQKLLTYFLILSFVFTFVIPAARRIELINANIGNLFDSIAFNFTLGYVSYFVLGYYLTTIKIKSRTRCLLYFLGTVGIAITVLLTRYFSIEHGTTEEFYGYVSLNTLATSIAVFVMGRFAISKLPIIKIGRLGKVIAFMSKATFGAYLSHALFIDLFYNITTASCMPWSLAVIITIMLSTIFSFITSIALSKIPYLGKYIT